MSCYFTKWGDIIVVYMCTWWDYNARWHNSSIYVHMMGLWVIWLDLMEYEWYDMILHDISWYNSIGSLYRLLAKSTELKKFLDMELLFSGFPKKIDFSFFHQKKSFWRVEDNKKKCEILEFTVNFTYAKKKIFSEFRVHYELYICKKEDFPPKVVHSKLYMCIS